MENISNSNQHQGTITGVFSNREDAEKAYNHLLQKGYTSDEISVLMSDETRKTHFSKEDNTTDLGSKAMEKAGVGSAIGGTAGAIIGAIAAIGTSIAIPGLGLVIAGPLAAGLTGAGAGGLTGGLIGALIGSGIPKERAEAYENRIKAGGIVLGITPKTFEEGSLIADNWRNNYRGEEIHGVTTDTLDQNFASDDARIRERDFDREESERSSGIGAGTNTMRTATDYNENTDDLNRNLGDANLDREVSENREGRFSHSSDELDRRTEDEASIDRQDMLAKDRNRTNENLSSGSGLGSSTDLPRDRFSGVGNDGSLNIKGNWNEIKGKLKQQYANLTDEDLTYREGREEEMLGKLQQKTGKSRSELAREINGLNFF